MATADRHEGVVDLEASWAFDHARFVDTEVPMVALDRAAVGVVVIDADLRFVFVNGVAATINGHRADEHIGKSLFDIAGDTAPTVAPMIRNVMASGVAVIGQEIVGETDARPGEIRSWTGDYLPYRIEGDDPGDGAANAVLVVFREVTDTRRAERQLRQVIDGLFTFVGLCAVDGTLLEANQFALDAAGIESGDVIGRPFWDCYWWSYDAGVQAQVRDAVALAAAGTTCRFDVPVRIAGERIIPIDFQLVPVVEHGRVVSLVPSGIDIESRLEQVRTLSELTALATDLHVAIGLHELVDLIVGRASGLLGTAMVNLAVVDARDDSLWVTSPAELDRDIADRWRTLPVDGPRTPFHDAVETAREVWLFDRHERRDRYPQMADDSDLAGLVVTAALPLTDATGVIGVLGLGWSKTIEDEPSLRIQASLLANLCAQALHRVIRTRSTMELINSLTALLMARRDHTDQLDVAVGYVPAVSQVGFGGDWYDVVTVDANTTALVVGDVVGHNVEAAARMAVTRSALRTALLAKPGLIGVSDLVTRSLGLTEREFFATALVAMVDTAHQQIRWKSFGHVPALLRAPDGEIVRLAETGPPIGLLVDKTPIGTMSYEPGSMLLLYTDGLIETRSEPIDVRLDALAAALARVPAGTSPADVVESLMATIAPTDPGDDIAIVVAALPAG